MRVAPILLVSVILLSLAYFFARYSEEAGSPAIDIDSVVRSVLGNVSVAIVFENESIATEIGSQLIGNAKSVDFYNVRDVDRALGRYRVMFLTPEAADKVSMDKPLVLKLVESNTTIILLDRDPSNLFRAFNSSEAPVTLIPVPLSFISNGEQIEPRIAATVVEVYAYRNLTRYPVSYTVFGEKYSKRYLDILREWARSLISTGNKHRCGICTEAQVRSPCQYTCIGWFSYVDAIGSLGTQEYTVTFAYTTTTSGQLGWRTVIEHRVYATTGGILPLATLYGWRPEPNRITVDVSKYVMKYCNVWMGNLVCGVTQLNRDDQRITRFEPPTATTYYSASGLCSSSFNIGSKASISFTPSSGLYLGIDHSDEFVNSSYYNGLTRVRVKWTWGQSWYSFPPIRDGTVGGYVDTEALEPFTPIITFRGVLTNPREGYVDVVEHKWGFVVYKASLSNYSLGTPQFNSS